MDVSEEKEDPRSDKEIAANILSNGTEVMHANGGLDGEAKVSFQYGNKDEGDRPPSNNSSSGQTITDDDHQLDPNMGEEMGYYENAEMFDPYYYGFPSEMQDPSFYGRGRAFPRRGSYPPRGSSFRRPSRDMTKKKRVPFAEERTLAEPISDLSSWPKLERAAKSPEAQEKKDNLTLEKNELHSPEPEEVTSPTDSSSKKKGINWVPFKDIGPPPRQFPSSRGRPSRRRGDPPRPWGSSQRSGGGFRREGRGFRGYQTGAPPFPYVPLMVPLEGDVLGEAILRQVEYYFSVENLCKDLYLRRNMDSEGWVPVGLLADFNRVKALTTDPNEILQILADSELVEVKDDKLRRKDDWKLWLLPLEMKEALDQEKKPKEEDKNQDQKEEVKEEVPKTRGNPTN